MIEFKSKYDAEVEGFFSLTRPYNERQGHLWQKVVQDMRAGDIKHCLVKVTVESQNGDWEGVEVWRER